MTAKEKIEKSLTEKGYEILELEFEPVQYFGSGREGGWSIEVDDEVDNFPEESWSKLTDFAIANNIVCDCGNGYIMCYNVKDALALIGQLPHFNSTETVSKTV